MEVWVLGGKGGGAVRALTSHQCGPGFNPGVDAVCGLSLLLVLFLAPKGFSPGSPVSPPLSSKFKSTRNQIDEEPFSERATSESLFIYPFTDHQMQVWLASTFQHSNLLTCYCWRVIRNIFGKGESLLTSLLTFLLISVRLYP